MALTRKKELIEVMIALFVVVGMAFGANEYFAKHDDLFLVQSSQRLHFTAHAINETQARIWNLEDRYGTDNCLLWNNPKDKEEYRQLKEKLEKLKKKEDHLIKTTTNNEGG
jgi:hypothetical protein